MGKKVWKYGKTHDHVRLLDQTCSPHWTSTAWLSGFWRVWPPWARFGYKLAQICQPLKIWSKSMAKYQQSYYKDLLSSNTKSVKIMSKTVAGLKFITLILRKFSSASWSTRLDSLKPAQLWNCLHWFFIQNVYQQLFRYFYTLFLDTMVVLACVRSSLTVRL